MEEARAQYALQLEQRQAEARQRWAAVAARQSGCNRSHRWSPLDVSRRLRAHQMFMAELDEPVSPSNPRQRALVLPQPRPYREGEGVLRQTRHDVSHS